MEYHKGVVKMNCYFCEVKPATTTKFSEPSCDTCKQEYIGMLNPLWHKKTDKEKAAFYKFAMKAVEQAFSEDA